LKKAAKGGIDVFGDHTKDLQEELFNPYLLCVFDKQHRKDRS
jgi:hypothetical protein